MRQCNHWSYCFKGDTVPVPGCECMDLRWLPEGRRKNSVSLREWTPSWWHALWDWDLPIMLSALQCFWSGDVNLSYQDVIHHVVVSSSCWITTSPPVNMGVPQLACFPGTTLPASVPYPCMFNHYWYKTKCWHTPGGCWSCVCPHRCRCTESAEMHSTYCLMCPFVVDQGGRCVFANVHLVGSAGEESP